jgi:hypothetical protein
MPPEVMMKDSIDERWTAADDAIEEVREIRRRISARFDHDPVNSASTTWSVRSGTETGW